MKATEKQQISDQFGRMVCKFMNKHCNGMPYQDIVMMMLRHTHAFIAMCVRSSVARCKKNSKKADKLASEIFCAFGELPKDERIKAYQFKDDEDEPEPGPKLVRDIDERNKLAHHGNNSN